MELLGTPTITDWLTSFGTLLLVVFTIVLAWVGLRSLSATKQQVQASGERHEAERAPFVVAELVTVKTADQSHRLRLTNFGPSPAYNVSVSFSPAYTYQINNLDNGRTTSELKGLCLPRLSVLGPNESYSYQIHAPPNRMWAISDRPPPKSLAASMRYAVIVRYWSNPEQLGEQSERQCPIDWSLPSKAISG